MASSYDDGIFARIRTALNSGKGAVIGLIAALVVLGTAGFLIYHSVTAKAGDVVPVSPVPITYFCQSCQATGVKNTVEHLPLVCPQCGKKTAVLGTKCACGQIVELRRDKPFECPNCHKVNDFRRDEGFRK